MSIFCWHIRLANQSCEIKNFFALVKRQNMRTKFNDKGHDLGWRIMVRPIFRWHQGRAQIYPFGGIQAVQCPSISSFFMHHPINILSIQSLQRSTSSATSTLCQRHQTPAFPLPCWLLEYYPRKKQPARDRPRNHQSVSRNLSILAYKAMIRGVLWEKKHESGMER